MDARPDPERLRPLELECRKRKLPFLRISAVSGEGLDRLTETIWRELIPLRKDRAVSGVSQEGNLQSGSTAS
jgi:hypothetical protein